MWLTDIHADPYYGGGLQQCKDSGAVTAKAPYGILGCDPPQRLWESAAAAAANVSRNLSVDFVLFTGDFMRHGQDHLPQPGQVVLKVVADTTRTLLRHFPRVPLVPAVTAGAMGNDDSPANYALDVTTDLGSNPWLSRLGKTLGDLGVVPPEALQSYRYGGFHQRILGPVTLLTINTLVYSRLHVPVPRGPLPEDPFRQLRWLRNKLETAAAQKRPVWIAGHIPPGTETFGYTALWHHQYVAAYLQVVQNPRLAPWIAAQLFGHVHADEFRVAADAPEGTGPVLLAGSVSPIFRGNPSFRVLEYEPQSGRLLGYRVYWANLSAAVGGGPLAWQLGYDALEAYEQLRQSVKAEGALTQAAFGKLAEAMAEGGEVWETFVAWYKTQVPNDLSNCRSAAETGAAESRVATACLKAYIRALTIDPEETGQPPSTTGSTLGPKKEERGNGILDSESFYDEARKAHIESLRSS